MKKGSLDIVVKKFGKKVIANMDSRRKKALNAILLSLKNGCGHSTTHWEIVLTPADNFFYLMRSALFGWRRKQIFVDQKVLRLVAQNVVKIYLDNWAGRDKLPYCKKNSGDMMTKLNFFPEAIDFYEEYRDASECKEDADKSIRQCLAAYRASSLIDDKLETKIGLLIQAISSNAQSTAIWEIRHPQKWVPWGQEPRTWHAPLRQAKTLLFEFGLDEAEVFAALNPVYQAVKTALISDRDEHERPGDTWWQDQLIKISDIIIKNKS